MTRRADASFASALALARDSLSDARLLADHGRRNDAVLLDLALKQALAAISLSLGLGAPDGLPLDTLLGRVPADHPASGLVGRLADPRARDADTVEQLIAAVSPPGPAPKATTRRREETERPAPMARAASTARSTVVAGGPTAFETAAAARGHAPTRGNAGTTAHATSSKPFWELMDRWGLSDADALALLGGTRGLTRKSTRPRFRLQGGEAARFAMLLRIHTALEILGETPDWLFQGRKGPPFAGRTPLAALQADPDEAGPAILHGLNRAGLRG